MITGHCGLLTPLNQLSKRGLLAKTWKQPKCPSTEEWIKMYINTMEYYSAIKRKEITSFVATWMDLEIIMLSEVSQTMRHQHTMLSLTCGIWKKDRLIFFAEQMLTHRHQKTYGLKMGQVGGWEDALRVWDGNAIKFGCDDCCTPINVIKFIK